MRVLLLNENGTVVLQGIEYDIAAQGKTREEAEGNFRRTVAGQVHLDRLQGKEPLSTCPPMPDYYRKMNATEIWVTVSQSKPKCQKRHRFRPVSFDERTGFTVFACKCDIAWIREPKFVC